MRIGENEGIVFVAKSRQGESRMEIPISIFKELLAKIALEKLMGSLKVGIYS